VRLISVETTSLEIMPPGNVSGHNPFRVGRDLFRYGDGIPLGFKDLRSLIDRSAKAATPMPDEISPQKRLLFIDHLRRV
jgi:hypothetical protein